MEEIRFKVNGKSVGLKLDGDRALLWVLRTDYHGTYVAAMAEVDVDKGSGKGKKGPGDLNSCALPGGRTS